MKIPAALLQLSKSLNRKNSVGYERNRKVSLCTFSQQPPIYISPNAVDFTCEPNRSRRICDLTAVPQKPSLQIATAWKRWTPPSMRIEHHDDTKRQLLPDNSCRSNTLITPSSIHPFYCLPHLPIAPATIVCSENIIVMNNVHYNEDILPFIICKPVLWIT